MASLFDSFDLDILAPKSQSRALAWLGRHDWLKLTPKVGREIGIGVLFPEQDDRIPKDDYNRMKYAVDFCKASNIMTEVIWTWSLSKMYASGPKLFRPTLEQCEAMSQVELQIPFSEYAQPYPTIIYEYPKEFCEVMAANLGCIRFPSVALCHQSETGFIHVSSLFSQGDAITALLPPREGETIEEVLVLRPTGQTDHNEAEFTLGETLHRIALNFSLMMTHYRVVDKPLNKDAWRKHREMAKDKDNEKRDKGKRLASQDIRLIAFEQHIAMYDERVERASGPHEVTGRHVRPHWRKGHWRMQPHGPGNSLRKRLLIKSLMVKKELFVGDMVDTKVVYEGKNRTKMPQDTEKHTEKHTEKDISEYWDQMNLRTHEGIMVASGFSREEIDAVGISVYWAELSPSQRDRVRSRTLEALIEIERLEEQGRKEGEQQCDI